MSDDQRARSEGIRALTDADVQLALVLLSHVGEPDARALIAGTLVAVPREATEAMLGAAAGEHYPDVLPEVHRKLRRNWSAMIAEHTKGRAG